MKKIKNSFKNLPIQLKINAAITFTCFVALTVTAAAIFVTQIFTFRHSFQRDLEATSDMIRQTITASLEFNDDKGAEEILASVRAKPQILSASVDLPNGSQFAAFKVPRLTHVPAVPRSDGPHFVGPFLALNAPIMLKGERLGTIRLICDYRAACEQSLSMYGAIIGTVLVVSILLALILSDRLQRLISFPIVNLAEMAQEVADRNDYTLRAPYHYEDEVGALTAAFNKMLARIQAQDHALNQSQAKMEAMVHSVDGIVWECDPETFQFTFLSRQCERILGYKNDEWLANETSWQQNLHREDASRAIEARREAVTRMQPYHSEYRMIAANDRVLWVRESGVVMVEQGKPAALRGIFMDITAQKQALEELDKVNKCLVEASRVAGMSDVATSVLHNVGNVLNSVNVSACLINDHLRNSKAGALSKACALLDDHANDLADFLTKDPKGRKLPEFLGKLARVQEEEKSGLMRESQLLAKNVEHIKEIVAMQQSYARIAGVTEDLSPVELIEDAIRINEGAFMRHGVTLKREFEETPRARVDKHKVLQILVNLFRNAKYALDSTGRNDKVLTVAVRDNGPGRVKIIVRDNGIGIPKENLTRIFGHGFTTKKDGHGFGLHSGALAAREMGGSLQAFSDGPGAGAIFVLELPTAPPGNN